MDTTVTALPGLAHQKMGDWLAAAGLARLIGQALPDERTAWTDHGFVTTVAPDILIDGLVHRTPFTAVAAPWSTGAGISSEHADALIRSRDWRAQPMAQALNTARFVTALREHKANIVLAYRDAVDENATAWVDACLVDIGGRWAYRLATGGTGGNFARFDIARNYMLAVADVLADSGQSAAWLTAALVGGNPKLVKRPSGPYGLGDLVNPWSFILQVEGMIALRPSPTMVSAARASNASSGASVGAWEWMATGPESRETKGQFLAPGWADLLTWRELSQVLTEPQWPSGSRPRTIETAAVAISQGYGPRGLSAAEPFDLPILNGKVVVPRPILRGARL